MATVHIPAHLRRLCGGRTQVEVQAGSVQGALAELAAAFPAAREALLRTGAAGAPEISRYLGVFVDGQDYRELGGAACPLRGGERIDLLLPLAGG